MANKPVFTSPFLKNMQKEVDEGRAVKIIRPTKVIYLVGEGKYFGCWRVSRKPMRVCRISWLMMYQSTVDTVKTKKYTEDDYGYCKSVYRNIYSALPAPCYEKSQCWWKEDQKGTTRVGKWMKKYPPSYLVLFPTCESQVETLEFILSRVGKERYIHPDMRTEKERLHYENILNSKVGTFITDFYNGTIGKIEKAPSTEKMFRLVNNVLMYGVRKGVKATWPKLSQGGSVKNMANNKLQGWEISLRSYPYNWFAHKEFEGTTRTEWGSIRTIDGIANEYNISKSDMYRLTNKMLKTPLLLEAFELYLVEERRARKEEINIPDRNIWKQVYTIPQYKKWHDELVDEIRKVQIACQSETYREIEERHAKHWALVLNTLPEDIVPLITYEDFYREKQEQGHCIDTYFHRPTTDMCATMERNGEVVTIRWTKSLALEHQDQECWWMEEARTKHNAAITTDNAVYLSQWANLYLAQEKK